jgi:CRISPR-associated protein Csm4
MNCYRAILKVQGLLKIPIVSDTLWGHIAWGIALEEGEEALEAFLQQYDESPPLVLSHAFPCGYLPRPLFRIAPPDSPNIKKLMKIGYLPKELFAQPIGWQMLDTLIKNNDLQHVAMASESRIRNAIDRISSTVEGEKLWSEQGLYWYERSNETSRRRLINQFDIYCFSSWTKDELGRRIEQGLRNGYGGKSSIGYGNVKLLDIKEEKPPLQGRRAMSLGTFIPVKGDKLENLSTKIVVRSGKLGSIFSATMNPFKKPLVFYDEGTTFDRPQKDYVGGLVPNVHPDARIHSCGITLYATFQEEEAANDNL